MRKSFGHGVTLCFLLQLIVADLSRCVHGHVDVAGIEEAELLRVCAGTPAKSACSSSRTEA